MALYVGGTSVTGSQVLDATTLSGTLPALNASSLTNLDAADLSGTLPAINGSNLTNLPSSAPSTSEVGSATAGLAVNSIGSYCPCFRNPRANHNAGDSVAGSVLQPTSFACYPRTTWNSGTWRCMGRTNTGSHGDGRDGTVFLRIS